jgi:hypothetical protein
MHEEVNVNIWDKHDQGEWIAITTNPIINSRGELVMGRGVAEEAKLQYPHLPTHLAMLVLRYGNIPFVLSLEKIITLPVKHHWREQADIRLIIHSLNRLYVLAANLELERIFIPRPGCGNGKLDWSMVRATICSKSLAKDMFIFVTNEAT